MTPNEQPHEVTQPADGPEVSDPGGDSDPAPAVTPDDDQVGEEQAERNREQEPPA